MNNKSALDKCDDGYANQHYTRVVDNDYIGWDVIQLQGHHLVCSYDEDVEVNFVFCQLHLNKGGNPKSQQKEV